MHFKQHFAGKFTHNVSRGPNNVIPKMITYLKTLVQKFHKSTLLSISPNLETKGSKCILQLTRTLSVYGIAITLEANS